jgi:hypothetical protein
MLSSMELLLHIVSIAAGVVGVVSGVRKWFGKRIVERDLMDRKQALARCRQINVERKLALARCELMWRYAAVAVVVVGIALLLSRYSLARSA